MAEEAIGNRPNWFDYLRLILFVIGTVCIGVVLYGTFKSSIITGFALIGIYQVCAWFFQIGEFVARKLLFRICEGMNANG